MRLNLDLVSQVKWLGRLAPDREIDLRLNPRAGASSERTRSAARYRDRTGRRSLASTRTSGLGGLTQPRLECHAIAMMATIALASARRQLAACVVAQVSPVVTHRGSQCAHKQP